MITTSQILDKINVLDRPQFEINVKLFEAKTGCPARFILPIMYFESGGTMRPNIYGGYNNSYVGLIQFGSQAANAIGTTQIALSLMGQSEQMNYVTKYYELWNKSIGSKYSNISEAYLTVLYPAAKNRPADEPLNKLVGKQATKLYDIAGNITKNSIEAFFVANYEGVKNTPGNVIADAIKKPQNYIAISLVVLIVFLIYKFI